MTSSWSLPLSSPPRRTLSAPPLNLTLTRAVVPTCRDWDEARETIESLLACAPRPVEIVLVDDNAEENTPRWARRPDIVLVRYPGNGGPSRARNAGAALQTGRPIDWLYFTDTGCTRDPDFFTELHEAVMADRVGCVACAGPVRGVLSPLADDSPINSYMTVERILYPPRDEHGPQAIITANALVSAVAFRAVGGFDVSYPFAAAEDIDLGVRLRAMGGIAWAPGAIVRHRFEECIDDFQRRFTRYGRGAAHLEHRLALKPLRPAEFAAASRTLQYLADLQVRSMRIGYDAHKAELAARARSHSS